MSHGAWLLPPRECSLDCGPSASQGDVTALPLLSRDHTGLGSGQKPVMDSTVKICIHASLLLCSDRLTFPVEK